MNTTKIDTKLPNSIIQDLDEDICSKYESILTDNMSSELDNRDNKNQIKSIHQIKDENGKFSSEKDLISTREFEFIKIETREGVCNEDDNKELVCLNLEDEHMLNGLKIERVNFDSTNTEGCAITKVEVKDPSGHVGQINENTEDSTLLSTTHSGQKSYKCHSCDYSSSWKEYLQSHIKSVHLKKPPSFKCHLCDKSSYWKGDLVTHINNVHLKIKNYKCSTCNYSSAQKAAIRAHINSVHLKLKDHKCHLCDYTCSTKGHLQLHIKSVHLKLKNHKCHMCDYSSSTKCILQSHIKSVHLKIKKHECFTCGYSSLYKTAIRTHINSVHLKRRDHKCHLCNYASSTNAYLQTHIKTVHLKQKINK